MFNFIIHLQHEAFTTQGRRQAAPSMHRRGHLQEEVHVLFVPEHRSGPALLHDAKGVRQLRIGLQMLTGMERERGRQFRSVFFPDGDDGLLP